MLWMLVTSIIYRIGSWLQCYIFHIPVRVSYTTGNKFRALKHLTITRNDVWNECKFPVQNKTYKLKLTTLLSQCPVLDEICRRSLNFVRSFIRHETAFIHFKEAYYDWGQFTYLIRLVI